MIWRYLAIEISDEDESRCHVEADRHSPFAGAVPRLAKFGHHQ